LPPEDILQYQKERKKKEESKSFVCVGVLTFLETDYVSFLIVANLTLKPAIYLEN